MGHADDGSPGDVDGGSKHPDARDAEQPFMQSAGQRPLTPLDVSPVLEQYLARAPRPATPGVFPVPAS